MIRRLLLTSAMVAVQLLDARSVLMEPRPAQVSFADKVNAYVTNVQNKTPKDGVGQVLSSALLLTQNSPMTNVTAILNELGPHLLRDKNVAEQEACSASLIKILVPIVGQFETALFKEIHKIERSLEYWQYQELHPVSYFVHKSPIKYFTFDQKEEVADKIQVLKKIREKHFELLGTINIQLSSFDMQATVHDQYAWIQKLCHVLCAYDETLRVADDLEIFPLLYEATNMVSQYKAYMQKQLGKYYIPSVFVRRWMEMTAGTAALAGGGRYLMNDTNRQWITTKVAKGKDNLTAEFGKHIANFRTAIFGDERDEALLTQNYVDAVNLFKKIGQTQLKKDKFGDLWDDLVKDVGDKPNARIVGRMSDYVVFKFGKGFELLGDAVKKASGSIGQPATLSNLGNFSGIKEGISQLLDALGSSEIDNNGKEEQDDKEEVSGKEVKLLASINVTAQVLNLQRKLQQKEHRMLWAILYAAPIVAVATAAGVGSCRLIKKLYARFIPDCGPIRVALVDIALLLNVYGDAAPNEIDPSDFGRLSYLAHKLELDIRLIPKQYRESFLIEVGLLRTSSLNAQQKMKVIDLMYKKYPFLAFQGMMAA